MRARNYRSFPLCQFIISISLLSAAPHFGRSQITSLRVLGVEGRGLITRDHLTLGSAPWKMSPSSTESTCASRNFPFGQKRRITNGLGFSTRVSLLFRVFIQIDQCSHQVKYDKDDLRFKAEMFMDHHKFNRHCMQISSWRWSKKAFKKMLNHTLPRNVQGGFLAKRFWWKRVAGGFYEKHRGKSHLRLSKLHMYICWFRFRCIYSRWIYRYVDDFISIHMHT